MSAPIPDRNLNSHDAAGNRDQLQTAARIALATTGVSIATRHALDFSLAHAQARDAVHSALAVPSLLAALRARNLAAITVKSAAPNRTEYLRRPDLGRALSSASAELLAAHPGIPTPNPITASTEPGAPFMQSHRMSGSSFAEANDRPSSAQPATRLTLILADGLSALATDRHAIPLLDALLPLLQLGEPTSTWQLTPIVIAEQARVALGDVIGPALHADATVILLGERPGLSSPDSLGAYVTWSPRPGRTDAERNCVSNIRPPLTGQLANLAGLDYASAAAKILWYLGEGRRLGLSGVPIREQDAHPSTPRSLR
jgi:ethanolamine ammonia-lyase small subunit